jgi:apolipoprotein N-acyltransferase
VKEPEKPAGSRWLPHAASVAIAIVIFTLIYDPFHASVLAFIALAPVTLVFADPRIACSVTRAALCGAAFGLGASMAIVGPWMFAASVDYFDRSSAWSLAFTLGVNAAYVALFYAPAFVAVRLVSRLPPAMRALGAASAWIAIEALRTSEPFGNAWALLGHGLLGIPILQEAAAFGGVWTLGLGAAVCGSAIGVALQPDVGMKEVMRISRIALAAPVVLAVLGAVAHYGDEAFAPLQPLRVAVVQAEIPSRDVWDPAKRIEHWNSYVSATEALRPGSVDLVVWPESAAPFLLDADVSARTKLVELSTKLEAAILLGAPRSSSSGTGRAALHNSVYYF